jgi:hypothetical protein
MAVDSTRSSKKRGCLKWGGVAVGALALLLVVVLALVWVQGSRAKAALHAKYAPPGQMVDVGGYQMHIYCQGTGNPTVVPEPGSILLLGSGLAGLAGYATLRWRTRE